MQQLENYLARVTTNGSEVDGGRLKLNVQMVYEDLGTGVRARQTLDETLHRLAVYTDVHVKMWKFDLLREPSLHQQAVDEATEARVVFVSAHGREELPATVWSWFQQWLTSRSGEPFALVVSLDAEASNTPLANQITEALGAEARLAGVDVFLHFGEVQTELESTVEDRPYRAAMG